MLVEVAIVVVHVQKTDDRRIPPQGVDSRGVFGREVNFLETRGAWSVFDVVVFVGIVFILTGRLRFRGSWLLGRGRKRICVRELGAGVGCSAMDFDNVRSTPLHAGRRRDSKHRG